MAYLEARPGGYLVAWRDGKGAKKQYTPLIETKPEAIATLERIEAQVAAKAPMRRGIALSLIELVERWRIARVAEKNDPEFSKRDKARVLSLVTARKWSTTESITPAAVKEWYGESATTQGASRLLQAFLRWARDYGMQPVDPQTLIALRPRRTSRKPPGRLLTAEEVATLEAKAGEFSADCRALVHCLATYGWRPITAARLVVGDLDLVAETITTKVKSGDQVSHPLLPATLALLRPLVEDRKPEDPLFIDSRYGVAFDAIDGHTISLWFRDHMGEKDEKGRKAQGEKVYNLKRYAISRLLEQGLPPQTIMLFTGHRTAAQVLKYARTSEEKAREALLSFPGVEGQKKAIAKSMAKAAKRAEKVDKRTEVEKHSDALHAAILHGKPTKVSGRQWAQGKTQRNKRKTA